MWFKTSRQLEGLFRSIAASGDQALEWSKLLYFLHFMEKRRWVYMGWMTIKHTVCEE